MVLGELRQGVERTRRNDVAAAARLERWLEALQERYAGRVLQIDGRIVDEWGRLEASRPLPVVDGLIAATALVYDLTVVTRNTRDFETAGVRVVNPFDPA